MISIKLAKEISIAKWEDELGIKESTIKLKEYQNQYSTLRNHHNCGFCLRYGYSYETHSAKNICSKCEISSTPAKCCLNDDSLYNYITESDDDYENIEEAIKELIEIIKNIPEEDE